MNLLLHLERHQLQLLLGEVAPVPQLLLLRAQVPLQPHRLGVHLGHDLGDGADDGAASHRVLRELGPHRRRREAGRELPLKVLGGVAKLM